MNNTSTIVISEDFEMICSIANGLVGFQEKFATIKNAAIALRNPNPSDDIDRYYAAGLIINQSEEMETEVQAMLRALGAFIEANKPEE